jgi:pimeloyl-ACP methyl ester carboxylesterase
MLHGTDMSIVPHLDAGNSSLLGQTNFAHEIVGAAATEGRYLFVWGHGWGQDRRAFFAWTQSLSRNAAHLLLDFPGFGASGLPPDSWGTEQYADAAADLIAKYDASQKVIWVGHSFGGRVGIQLAARHPDLLDGLVLISAAGLPRRRTPAQAIRVRASILVFKSLKKIAQLVGYDQQKLYERFGSADYRTAGPLRQVFLRVVNEDLTEPARRIRCPVLLLYGQDDTETPPELGQRLAQLIPKAQLSILPGQDHYSVLAAGRHILIKRLSDFVDHLG